MIVAATLLMLPKKKIELKKGHNQFVRTSQA